MNKKGAIVGVRLFELKWLRKHLVTYMYVRIY